MDTETIKVQFNISHFLAKKYYERSCLEHHIAPKTFYTQLKANRENKQNWLLQHKDQLLNPAFTAVELAERLNKTKSQIKTARGELRKLLNMKTESGRLILSK